MLGLGYKPSFTGIVAVIVIIILLLCAGYIEVHAACGPPTYAGCSGAQLRAIQQGQFVSRKVIRSDSYSSKADYWTDRTYQDRKDLAARNERKEARELESRVRVEEAKRYKPTTIYVDNGYRGRRVYSGPSKPSKNVGQYKFHYNQFGKKVYTNGNPNTPVYKTSPKPKMKRVGRSN